MRIGSLRFAQVKCNFCLEWMSLSTDTKMNINICDQCLALGVEGDNLKAISSEGNLYKIYVVKQNSAIQARSPLQILNCCDEKRFDQDKKEQNEDKTQFLQEIDEFRHTELNEILAKWNILTSFLKQKQILSHPQIQYLRKICLNASQKIQQTHEQFQNNFRCSFNSFQDIEGNLYSQAQQYEVPNSFCSSPSTVKRSANSLNQVEDKQNTCSDRKATNKLQRNSQKLTESIRFTSPKKVPLKQRDLNSIDISLCKLSDLKENNETFSRPSQLISNDCNTSIASSGWRKDLFLPLSSIRSSRSGSILNSISNRNNKQLVKKYQVVRTRIVRYLQNNYQSNSYIRLMYNLVMQAYLNASLMGKSLQLISYNLKHVDFRCFLEAFEWDSIQVLKLVKTKLSDSQLRILVEFIQFNNLQLKTLVLTNNKLTEQSVMFLNVQNNRCLREIYLGRNRIKKDKVRREIVSLENKYSLYL